MGEKKGSKTKQYIQNNINHLVVASRKYKISSQNFYNDHTRSDHKSNKNNKGPLQRNFRCRSLPQHLTGPATQASQVRNHLSPALLGVGVSQGKQMLSKGLPLFEHQFSPTHFSSSAFNISWVATVYWTLC